jgi:hypothetical protein
MYRLPLAVFAALAIAAASIGVVACGGGGSSVSKDVTSQPGDGANSDSLFHADNLGNAIKKYTDKFGSDGVTNLKIEPNSLKATTSTGINIVTKDGGTQGLNAPKGVTIPNIGGGSGVSLADIDTSAPQKIVDSLKDKGVSFANVNYFLISPDLSTVSDSGKQGWLIYSTKGNFQAKADGSDAKPLGSGSLPSSITTPGGTTVDTKKLEDTAKTAESAATNAAKAAEGTAKSLQDCVAKAGTDPQKLAACAGH